MVVYKTYKYRVYPTQEQTAQIELTFKMCAFVWNKFLERLTKAYRRRGESLTIFDCDHILKEMKGYYPWLMLVDNKAMRSTIRNLFDAKRAFYRRLQTGEKPGYPRYKSERNPVSSYTTNAVIHVTDDYIQLPRVKRLKYKRSRPIEGSIVEATVTRDIKGRYYVSICCAVEAEPLPNQMMMHGPRAILGRLLRTTMYGSNTRRTVSLHQRSRAMPVPSTTAMTNPTSVSQRVVPMW